MNKTKMDLAEIKARNLPHMKASDALSIKEAGYEAEKAMAAADEYFSHFLPPGPCVGCGSRLGAKDESDALMGFLTGDGPTFTWGLAHGEGHCRKCGYPARAHHEVPEVGRIQNFILQYHPNDLEVVNPKTEMEAA